ncbi:MAG: hypothetical protein DDT41_01463 [candidate division WS2 bacterium]|nr:hypothetical protein [Candidatus Psychracetigena formicireducens]
MEKTEKEKIEKGIKKEVEGLKEKEPQILPQFGEVDKRFVELEGEAERPEWETMEFIPEPEEIIPIDERVEAIPFIPRATPEEVMLLGEYEPPEFAAFDFWTKYGMLLD